MKTYHQISLFFYTIKPPYSKIWIEVEKKGGKILRITKLRQKTIAGAVLLFLILGCIFCYNKGGISYFKYEVLSNTHYRINNIKNIDGGVVFLGDSITLGGNWNALFNMNSIVNKGVSGNKITDVIERMDDVTKSKPKKIFLLIGINDIKQPINSTGRISSTQMNDAISNYSVMVDKIIKESPKTQIYLESIMPVNNEMINKIYVKNKIYNFYINAQDIKEFNDGIKKVALKNNLTFIDLHSAFLPNEVLGNKYTVDGIHPNTTGYLVVQKYLNQYVK